MKSHLCSTCLPRFLASKGIAVTVRPLNMRETKHNCEECKLFGETSEAVFEVTNRKIYTSKPVERK